MTNVIEHEFTRNIYKTDYCSGCRELITSEEYTIIGLPNGDGSVITNIALCDDCTKEAEREGVI